MFHKLQVKIDHYYNLSDEDDKLKVELAAIDDFSFWSRITWCRFTYVYADNALNRSLGRVGAASGTRYGTRNLDLVPANKKPKRRNRNMKTFRYFDTGRAINKAGKNTAIRDARGKYTKNNNQAINGNWRSFRKDRFTVLTGIWSFERGKFVTDFSEFNIKNQPTG